MRCSKCDGELRDGATFCTACGAPRGDQTPGANSDRGPRSGQAATGGALPLYVDIPLYRRNGFVITLAVLLWWPLQIVLVAIMMTGDAYYERRKSIRVYSNGARRLLITWCACIALAQIWPIESSGSLWLVVMMYGITTALVATVAAILVTSAADYRGPQLFRDKGSAAYSQSGSPAPPVKAAVPNDTAGTASVASKAVGALVKASIIWVFRSLWKVMKFTGQLLYLPIRMLAWLISGLLSVASKFDAGSGTSSGEEQVEIQVFRNGYWTFSGVTGYSGGGTNSNWLTQKMMQVKNRFNGARVRAIGKQSGRVYDIG